MVYDSVTDTWSQMDLATLFPELLNVINTFGLMIFLTAGAIVGLALFMFRRSKTAAR